MVLNVDALSALFSNHVGTKTVGTRRVEPLRFSAKQDAHSAGNAVFGARAHCTAGISLDFTYDGSLIAFDFDFTGASSRQTMSIDLYADGVMVYTLFTFVTGEGVSHFEYRFPDKKPRRVQIYLPYTVGLAIGDFTLDDDAH